MSISIESILPIMPIYAIKGISNSPITEPMIVPITFLAFLSLATADVILATVAALTAL